MIYTLYVLANFLIEFNWKAVHLFKFGTLISSCMSHCLWSLFLLDSLVRLLVEEVNKWRRAQKRRLKRAKKRILLILTMLGGGWCTRELQFHSCALHCFHFWFEWLYHSILTLVLELLPSTGTLKLSGIGWKSLLICLSRNGIVTVQSMISVTGVLTTLLWLLIRVMSMAFSSDSLVLTQLLFSLPVAMSPIWGLYHDPSAPFLIDEISFVIVPLTFPSFSMFFLAENFLWGGRCYHLMLWCSFLLFFTLLLFTILAVTKVAVWVA